MRKKNISLPNKYELIFIITMSLLILAFWVGITSGKDSVQHLIFFAKGKDFFADFLNPIKWVSDSYFSTGYKGSELAFYPAFPLLLFYPFALLLKTIGNTYLPIVMILFLFIPTFLMFSILYKQKTGSKIKRIYIIFLLLMSGICLFSLERGNIVFYSTAGVFLYLFLYKSNNKIFRELSLIALAFSASIKIYPILFVFLLLIEKRYIEILRVFIYGALLTFIPFLIMPGGISNIFLWLEMTKKLSITYSNLYPELKFGLDGFIPIIAASSYKLNFLVNFINPLKFILLILSIAGIFCLDKYWKKILLITILTIVTPNPSFIYTCLNLFFPLILFLNEKEHKIDDLKYLILFIIILNPFQLAITKNLSINIICANIAILLMQLFLCIEGISFFYKRFVNNN